MGIVPNQEVDHEVVLLVRFRRFGIPGDERQVESFTRNAHRSLELTFGPRVQVEVYSTDCLTPAVIAKDDVAG